MERKIEKVEMKIEASTTQCLNESGDSEHKQKMNILWKYPKRRRNFIV